MTVDVRPADTRHDRRVVVACLGNELRRDDGAGPAVLAELGAGPDMGAAPSCRRLGSPYDLLGFWDRAELAVVVDAVQAGGQPGRVCVLELGGAGEGGTRAVSSHGPGMAEVLRLARVLDTAPGRVVVVGIEGDDFGHGAGLSEPVLRGVGAAAGAVRALLRTVSWS